MWVHVGQDSTGRRTVNLSSIGKDTGCTDPVQQSGKAADLVKAVIARVADFAGAHRVWLEDESMFTCNLPPNASSSPSSFVGHTRVLMAEHNALVHGATYYQRRLGAQPKEGAVRDTMVALDRHRATQLPTTFDILARKLTQSMITAPWIHKEVANAYHNAVASRGDDATWGDLYALLDKPEARARGGCAVLYRLFRLASAAAGLQSDRALRAAIWFLPKKNVRSWKKLVLRVDDMQMLQSGGMRALSRAFQQVLLRQASARTL